MILQDEKNQVLTTNIWLDHEWTDEMLTWNPAEFNNITKLRVGAIFWPSIMINRENMRHVAFSQTAAYIKIWLQPLKGWMMGKCWLMLKTCLHWNYFF